MTIEFRCTCGTLYSTASSNAGKTTVCKKCQRTNTIPTVVAAKVPSPPTRGSNSNKQGNSHAESSPDPAIPTLPADSNPFADLGSFVPSATSTNYYAAQFPSQPQGRKESTINWLLLAGITFSVFAVAGLVLVGIVTIQSLSSGTEDSRLAKNNNNVVINELSADSPDPNASTSVNVLAVQNITDLEAEEAAKKFVGAIVTRQRAVYDEMLDLVGLVDRALDGVPTQTGFRAGVLNGLKKGNVIDAIARVVASGGEYAFMRVSRIAGEPRAFVRINMVDSIDFHEYVFQRTPRGIEIRDIYDMARGESMGEGIRNMARLASVSDQSLLQRITGADTELVKYAKNFETIMRNKDTNPTVALQEIKNLPASIRNIKTISSMQFIIAQKVSESEYLAALQEYNRQFPDSRAADLMGIDLYALRGDFDEAMQCAQRVNDYVGGDPFLEDLIAKLSQ
ncbi:MAG: hypothetical protein KDB03_20780 [Planctomycetales bacterium]|nr:hypothetical protein [Planctomycetales bacterium]